jgi:Spy/CpxP family protein refolding chaperone
MNVHRRHHHGYARRHGGCWGFGPGFAWASATAGDGPRGSGLYFSTSSGDDDGLGSAGLGVRRPLRFLTWKLDLTNEQLAAVARILERLKIERAQGEVEQRRSAAAIADALEGESFDSAAAALATDHRADAARAVQKAVASALADLHAALEPDQRRRLAMLIRTRAISF